MGILHKFVAGEVAVGEADGGGTAMGIQLHERFSRACVFTIFKMAVVQLHVWFPPFCMTCPLPHFSKLRWRSCTTVYDGGYIQLYTMAAMQ